MPKAIAIVSGGLDSVTLAYLLHAEGYALHVFGGTVYQRRKINVRNTTGIINMPSGVRRSLREMIIHVRGVFSVEEGFTHIT